MPSIEDHLRNLQKEPHTMDPPVHDIALIDYLNDKGTDVGGLPMDPGIAEIFRTKKQETTIESYPYKGYEKMNGVIEKRNFPISGGPLYIADNPGIVIRPEMHFVNYLPQYSQFERSTRFVTEDGKPVKWNWIYARNKEAHITSRDDYEPIKYTESNPYPIEYIPGTSEPIGMWNIPNRKDCHLYQFRGAVTFLNPENDPDKETIMTMGLETYDKQQNGFDVVDKREARHVKKAYSMLYENMAAPLTPTSPLHPFTRSYPDRSRNAIVTSYNRTKLPIVDIEHRKAFRHIFITRPECYMMANGDQPSYQVLNDDDMATCWMRFPHVIRSLSPVYVTSSTFAPQYANWNWLLCNRVLGLQTANNTIDLVESAVKSVHGNTVTMGKSLKTNMGGTLSLSFRDTKYMDVFEMLRIWMLYIHKRRMGTFFPSFNGYQQVNGFYQNGSSVFMPGGYSTLHPYDRALDYCASIYDIVTNETGTKILYWCKYYGVYPTDLSNGMLSNDNNAPLTSEARISATFQYQYKQENIFKNLIEFNYNAGICDAVGNMRSDVSTVLRKSVPFLYREKGEGGTQYTNPNLPNYIGAASMFTGSPYIITEFSGSYDPWDWNSSMKNNMVQANLCFVPIFYGDSDENDIMNLGISNELAPTREERDIMVLQSRV